MNIAFSSIGLRDGEISGIVEKIAEIGYAGVEVWGPHLDAFLKNRGTAMALRTLCEGLKLEIAALAPKVDFTGSEDQCIDSIVYGKKYIDLAGPLEQPVILISTGRIGSGAADDDAYRQCIYALQELCEYAQPKGICLAVETRPNTLADSVAATLDLLDRVNFPNLRVALDTWYMFDGGGSAPVEAITAFRDCLIHIHMRNMSRRHKGPYGTNVRTLEKGDLDYVSVFNELKKISYTKSLSVEWLGIDRAHMWDYAEQDLAFIRTNIDDVVSG